MTFDVSTGLSSHHRPGGGFRNPWPTGGGGGSFADLARWMAERARLSRASLGTARELPRRSASLPDAAARSGRIAATWLGHSTVLLQVDDVTVLTDPVWARRLSPVPFTGPERWVPPMLRIDALPRVDIVLQSHNHYDHFDVDATRRLARRNPATVWCVPLGMAKAVRGCGARSVHELDWWSTAAVAVSDASAAISVTCVPAQHFSGRGLTDRDRTLWGGFTLTIGTATVYFAGDTGFHPLFGEIASRCGPFDLTIMPIGAYEPRWFMSRVHMNPEESVAAWRIMADVHQRDHGTPLPPMLGVHWGTYCLTNEPMTEPPTRTRDLWAAAGLPSDLLWVLAHGESRLQRIRAGYAGVGAAPVAGGDCAPHE